MDLVLHILFFISAAVLVVSTLLQGGKSAEIKNNIFNTSDIIIPPKVYFVILVTTFATYAL